MTRVRIMLVLVTLTTSFLSAAPAPADPLIPEIVVTTTDSVTAYGWTVVIKGEGTGVIEGGGLKTAFACSASVHPSGAVPSPVTAPAASQVTTCYFKTGNSQTPSAGRTLPGATSAVHGQYDLATYQNPSQICAVGKVIFEDNSEIRVPAVNESCTPV